MTLQNLLTLDFWLKCWYKTLLEGSVTRFSIVLLRKIAQIIMVTFGILWKTSFLWKLLCLLFGQLLETFLLHFIPTSGHTAWRPIFPLLILIDYKLALTRLKKKRWPLNGSYLCITVLTEEECQEWAVVYIKYKIVSEVHTMDRAKRRKCAKILSSCIHVKFNSCFKIVTQNSIPVTER